MTDNKHSITPSPELVDEWRRAPEYTDGLKKLTMVTITVDRLQYIATKAAQWGADQELEACLAEVSFFSGRSHAGKIRDIRRPKPPSLKEQALHELNDVYNRDKIEDSTYDTIRRALEALPE